MASDLAIRPLVALPTPFVDLQPGVLPANLSDDAPIVAFSDLTKKDPQLAQRLFAVAQAQVQQSGGSLESLQQLTRRTLVAATPVDATRALTLAKTVAAESSRALAVAQTGKSVADTIGTVATSLGEAALYPFLSQAIIIGAGAAAAFVVSPWAIIPGAIVLLGQGYASFTYFSKVKKYNFS